ncbi:Phosphate transporter [Trypanosoma melophagium]|uniref:Phosphate transporter n=1 Tax=Trypanosoma melophagium TaxID=715481 RepID=UPI00351A20F1|nr:Phosphate transporter [Trypanosoma melophagium]KAH9579107.1 Phosphate transporter [Trypanosoma melophagium]KAH9579108.1 Phosphate transporter [Trypanosoma melophagium]KAH9579109.1 Phosphate transporter [Trypanosoma melophagium]KAH9579112.1 Phosphate transporter [Trypanosoma melophagium]
MVNPYLWITVVGGILAFLTGCGVGMNDLANAFGTTYGSRILTLPQIVVLAAVCEFAGAVSLGAAVTSTISEGIADASTFSSEPYILMYGMLCALGAAFAWLVLATMLSLPVSSTHSIAGGIMGFALVYGGGGGVSWAKKKDDFPFVNGFVPIVVSWFISPLFTGIAAATIYGLIRFLVMRPANSVKRAMYAIPIIVAVTFFLESFFVLFKGAEARLHWDVNKAAWVAAIIGAGTGVLSIAFIPLLRRRVRIMTEKAARRAEEQGVSAEEVERELVDGKEDSPASGAADAAAGECHAGTRHTDGTDNVATANPGVSDDASGKKSNGPLTAAVVGDTDSSGDESRRDTEDLPTFEVQLYDNRAELVFRYLQVFTAICASFAHGASDVSKAIGPFAAIYSVYLHQRVVSKVDIPIWILCLGGAGLVVGLATFGLKIMRLLGDRVTKITPSRGFCAELSTALVVSFASGYGVPISSTHCITGAVVGISMMDVGFWKVRWMIVAKLYAGWIMTVAITGSLSALFFAQGIYAPSLSA